MYSSVLLWALVGTVGQCALPPGYDDELFCRPGYCLQAVVQPSGFSGPRTSFQRCCIDQGRDHHTPLAWGFKLEASYRQELLAQGYVRAIDCKSYECTAHHRDTPVQQPVGLFLAARAIALGAS